MSIDSKQAVCAAVYLAVPIALTILSAAPPPVSQDSPGWLDTKSIPDGFFQEGSNSPDGMFDLLTPEQQEQLKVDFKESPLSEAFDMLPDGVKGEILDVLDAAEEHGEGVGFVQWSSAEDLVDVGEKEEVPDPEDPGETKEVVKGASIGVRLEDGAGNDLPPEEVAEGLLHEWLLLRIDYGFVPEGDPNWECVDETDCKWSEECVHMAIGALTLDFLNDLSKRQPEEPEDPETPVEPLDKISCTTWERSRLYYLASKAECDEQCGALGPQSAHLPAHTGDRPQGYCE